MARWVRLVSLSVTGQGDKKKNLEAALKLLDEAMWDQPDLVCLPETFTGLGCDHKRWLETSETLDGETVSLMCERARKGKTWIICPILLTKDNGLANSAVVINRYGDIVGVYEKMFPTIGEMESGVVPGLSAPSFETDFGRVGCAICFDLNFEEVAKSLRQNGAELVCFCSMYPGGRQVQNWALEYGFWMLTAIASPQSLLVNPLGRILAQSQPNYRPIISASVNLDSVVIHLDYNYEKMKKLKEAYGPDAEWEVSQPEGRSLLTCHRKDATVWDWVKEFDLEPLADYFQRARKVRRDHLAVQERIGAA
ncbi:MAG: carbon-nitrogen hydrolase family protein [Armatimonadetes bacterium]|nr:carbon-nitrogen hydrolase family protein [Armatimonadota bacterium]MDW8121398.1 carbon-nitrogen hydrolase family protein [Armatimonadota bacterium]